MSEKAESSGVDQEVAATPLINSKNHTPGRELDALVAERVMGWTDVMPEGERERGHTWYVANGIPPEDQRGKIRYINDPYRQVPLYSTWIADAWRVVEKLAPHYVQLAFSRNEIGHWEIDWCVSEESYRAGYRTVVDYSTDYETDSLPLAICLAALRALDA